MFKSKNLREALGLTQEETAMLLRIAKSHLAMFEIGQRGLPTKAMLKLVTMYDYLQKNQQAKLSYTDLESENAKIVQHLEKELIYNRYKQALIERKLTRLHSEYQKCLSVLQLAEYLKTQLPEDEKPGKEFIEMIHRKGLNGIKKNGPAEQKKTELKLNALQKYQKELENELKQHKQ